MTTPPAQPDRRYDQSRAGNAGEPYATHPTATPLVEGGRAVGPASPGANFLGAVVGLVGTVIGVSLVIAGSGLMHQHLVTFASGVDGGGLTILVLGVLLLGTVVALGAWAPATPMLGGLLVSFVGIVGLLSDDFVYTLYDTIPSETDASYLYSWIGLGAMLALGLLLIASGLACSLARRRRPRL